MLIADEFLDDLFLIVVAACGEGGIHPCGQWDGPRRTGLCQIWSRVGNASPVPMLASAERRLDRDCVLSIGSP